MEAVAKYTFKASQEDELSFKKGSVVNVLDKDEDRNWYKAEQGNREGWIPNTYINMKPHSWFQGKITRKQAEEALKQQKSEGAFLIRESESSPGDFSLSVWTSGAIEHFKVFKDPERQYYLWSKKFPSLNKLVEYHTSNSVSKTHRICLSEVPSIAEEKVQARFTFTAQEQDELSFQEGDWITVLDRSDENWWKGKLDNSIGIFPSNYVTSPVCRK